MSLSPSFVHVAGRAITAKRYIIDYMQGAAAESVEKARLVFGALARCHTAPEAQKRLTAKGSQAPDRERPMR